MNREGIDCHKAFKVNELQNGKSKACWTDVWEIPVQTLGIHGVMLLEYFVTMSGAATALTDSWHTRLPGFGVKVSSKLMHLIWNNVHEIHNI